MALAEQHVKAGQQSRKNTSGSSQGGGREGEQSSRGRAHKPHGQARVRLTMFGVRPPAAFS